MKVMVCEYVPAWCYVDTSTGEVKRVEVWAWAEELWYQDQPWIVAQDAGELWEEGVEEVPERERAAALELLYAAEHTTLDASMVVAWAHHQTLLNARR